MHWFAVNFLHKNLLKHSYPLHLQCSAEFHGPLLHVCHHIYQGLRPFHLSASLLWGGTASPQKTSSTLCGKPWLRLCLKYKYKPHHFNQVGHTG